MAEEEGTPELSAAINENDNLEVEDEAPELSEADRETYKLTYFNARGTGESIRLLFKLAGVDFEDIRVDATVNPEGDQYSHNVLPALQVGDTVLYQSDLSGTEVAVCRFLARKFGLIGANELQAVACDQVVEDLFALRSAVIMLVCEQTNAPDFQAAYLDKFVSQIFPVFLEKLSQLLTDNTESIFYVGDGYTWADVFGAYTMEFIENILGEVSLGRALADFPRVQQHYKDVYSLPGLKAWIQERPPAETERDQMISRVQTLLDQAI